MAIVENWLPPSRENWEFITTCFQFFPLFTLVQWAVPKIYPMGKTSTSSRFNIPGKIGWITMEAPGFITLLYIMNTLPASLKISQLPWENKAMAGVFVNAPSHGRYETSLMLSRLSITFIEQFFRPS
jgi:3-oxo-5-alpha-steroid 4-dehydrogenase 1